MICFFSSRRRHTRFDCDWSSDVCSSDLWVGTAGSIGFPEISVRAREMETVLEENGPGSAARGREILVRLARSEEHTSELQSQSNLVCRLLLEKKKNT